MTRPTEKLVKTASRIMGYLVGTPHFKICYNTLAYPEVTKQDNAACDASFADDRLTRKSQQGHLIFYNSGPKKQQATNDSSFHKLDSFVSCGRSIKSGSVLHTMRILESLGSPQHGVITYLKTIALRLQYAHLNNMSPENSRTKV